MIIILTYRITLTQIVIIPRASIYFHKKTIEKPRQKVSITDISCKARDRFDKAANVFASAFDFIEQSTSKEAN